MPTPLSSDEIADAVISIFRENNIQNFVLAFHHPKEITDFTHLTGSAFWHLGSARALTLRAESDLLCTPLPLNSPSAGESPTLSTNSPLPPLTGKTS